MENSKKSTYIIAGISLILIAVAVYFLFIFQKSPKKPNVSTNPDNVVSADQVDIAKKPFVTLTPTSNGAEIIITIQNMSNFDKIEYELTYQADNPQITGEKIERGATGTDINPKDPKYEKSILLGTASKGVRSPDKGITDGKLTLHMFKGQTEYRSETPWDLIDAGNTKTQIKDRSSKVIWSIPALGQDYWIVVADTVGVPPASGGFNVKDATRPVYGAFSIAPQFKTPATVTVSVNSESQSLLLYSYNNKDQSWQKLDAKFDYSAKTASATATTFTTLVVVAPK
jgi:hypothetical protein